MGLDPKSRRKWLWDRKKLTLEDSDVGSKSMYVPRRIICSFEATKAVCTNWGSSSTTVIIEVLESTQIHTTCDN